MVVHCSSWESMQEDVHFKASRSYIYSRGLSQDAKSWGRGSVSECLHSMRKGLGSLTRKEDGAVQVLQTMPACLLDFQDRISPVVVYAFYPSTQEAEACRF